MNPAQLGGHSCMFCLSDNVVLGSTFGPCFQFPQVRNFGGRNTAKLAARARSDKSSFRTFSSRFEMQLSISYCCLPAPCSYDGIKRRHHIGTHSNGKRCIVIREIHQICYITMYLFCLIPLKWVPLNDLKWRNPQLFF